MHILRSRNYNELTNITIQKVMQEKKMFVKIVLLGIKPHKEELNYYTEFKHKSLRSADCIICGISM